MCKTQIKKKKRVVFMLEIYRIGPLVLHECKITAMYSYIIESERHTAHTCTIHQR